MREVFAWPAVGASRSAFPSQLRQTYEQAENALGPSATCNLRSQHTVVRAWSGPRA